MLSAILVYGAHARNHTAILIWIIISILYCVGAVILAIFNKGVLLYGIFEFLDTASEGKYI